MNAVAIPSPSVTRYRGAQPFADDAVSYRTFFGRDTAATALVNQILANRLVVVYARSGVGKSSLLNAGVIPRLREAGYQPLPVRVNDLRHGPKASLLDGVRAEAQRQGIEFVDGEPASLWKYFKTAEFWHDDILLTPVLLIDQFEELFTLQSEEAREVFLLQLGELVRGVSAVGGDDRLGGTPPVLHVVISLREDYLGLLEEAADRIPQIMDSRFRLLPMNEADALRAMTGPAAVDDPMFATRTFRFSDDLKEFLLRYLSQRTTAVTGLRQRRIEPFHLQLVCQRIEQLVVRKEASIGADGTITLADVGGEAALERTLIEFYGIAIDNLKGWRQRRRARRSCERLLISADGRRLSLEEQELQRQSGLKAEHLRVLVESRLLRVDRRTDSSYYELSHDALVTPILATRRLSGLLLGWTAMILGLGLAFGALVALFAAFDDSVTQRLRKNILLYVAGAGLGAYFASRAFGYGARSLNLFRGMTTFKSVWSRLLAVGLLCLSAVLSGLSLGLFVNPTAVLLTLMPILGFAMLAYPRTLATAAFRMLFTERTPARCDCSRIKRMARQFGDASLAATAIAAGFAATLVWMNLQHPEAIGWPLAAGMGSLVMGVIFKLLIATPIEQAADRGLQHDAPDAATAAKPLEVPERPSLRRLMAGSAVMILGWLAGGIFIGLDAAPPDSSLIILAVVAALFGLEFYRGNLRAAVAGDAFVRLARAALAAGVLATVPVLLTLADAERFGSLGEPDLINALKQSSLCIVVGIMVSYLFTAVSIAFQNSRDADTAED